jgi:FkbM family methyltransferase
MLLVVVGNGSLASMAKVSTQSTASARALPSQTIVLVLGVVVSGMLGYGLGASSVPRVQMCNCFPCPGAAASTAPLATTAAPLPCPTDAGRTPSLPVAVPSGASILAWTQTVSPLLNMLKVSADSFFSKMLETPVRKRGLVVEVGSFDGSQAKEAYDKGYQVLVLEPSPPNFELTKTNLEGPLRDPSRMVLLQAAASAKRGSATFMTRNTAGTGDHISLDGAVHVGEESNYPAHQLVKATVPTVALDDVVGTRKVWFLKVDVQGHEMHVFEGCRKMFQERRVSFGMFEFQPKQMGPDAHKLLEDLVSYGYDLFATGFWWSRGDGHGDEAHSFPAHVRAFPGFFRPEHAKGLGEWTDIVAVCRGCIANNYGSSENNAFLQPFSATESAEFARLAQAVSVEAPADNRASSAKSLLDRHRQSADDDVRRRSLPE